MHLSSLLVGLVLISFSYCVNTLGFHPLGGVHGLVLKKLPLATVPRLHEISIDETNVLLNEGVISSYDLVQIKALIDRTNEVNPRLHVVSELNPDALSIAKELDLERDTGHIRGPLHGIPILIKDNIATLDKMNNTAGSYALLGASVKREATVVTKLREAGAIILGKAAMGQWAQCRSRKASSSHGWSAYGGQVLGAYYSDQDPSGSSSGNAVAVSVGLAMGSVATETSGSIVLPGERSNIVGIKPTLGLTSRSMTIPISLRQDTIGPMARSVKDAAYLLNAFAGPDKYDNWTSSIPFHTVPNYVKACNYSAFNGARLGIPRNGINHFVDETSGPVLDSFKKAIKIISHAGAKVVDHADFAKFDFAAFARTSSIILDTDFVAGVKDYLSQLDHNPNRIRDLLDITHFTKSDSREEYPSRDTYVWDRQLMRNMTNDSPRPYEAYQANLRMAGEDGVLGVLDRYHLDALVMPTFASYQLPAIGGLPVVTVPLGFYPSNMPIKMNIKGNMVSVAPNIPYGIAFIGRKWSEEKLIALAYAFEQRTLVRQKLKPQILPTKELSPCRSCIC